MSATASHAHVRLVADDAAPLTPAAVVERPGASSELAYKGLLAFTFVMLIAPQETYPQLEVFRPAFLAAVVAIGAYVVHRLYHGQPVVVASRELWLSLALLWWTVLTIPMSLWPGGSVDVLRNLFIKALLVFWVIGHVVDSPLRLRRLVWCLVLMSVPIALTGIRKYLSGEMIENAARIEGYEAGLTANPNDLALMLNLLVPLTIALFLEARSLVRRGALVAVLAIQAAAVVVTFSRSGFVTLMTILALYSYRLSRQGRLSYVGALIVALAIASPLLPSTYVDRLATIVDTEKDETGSAQSRWSDMKAAAQYVVAYPVVGAGLGQDILALNEVRGEHWTAVHDVYLQYAVDLGVPGLLLYLLLVVSAVRTANRARRLAEARRCDEVARIAEAIWVSLIAFAVAAIFYPAGYNFYFYYFAGLAVAVLRIAGQALPRPIVHAGLAWNPRT